MDSDVAYNFVSGGIMDGVVVCADFLGEGRCVWDCCRLGVEVDR